MAHDDPSTPSADYEAAAPYLKMITAISGGVKTMREAGTTYLPRNEAESLQRYTQRLNNSRFTNIFADIVADLSMRPFQNPMTVGETTPETFVDFAEDVDAKGNDLNTFATQLFRAALEDGVTWVLVDYTKDVPEGATIAEERAIGVRPFWVHYRSVNVIAVYSERVEGEERLVHVRLRENTVERIGFEEVLIERIREFNQMPFEAVPSWTVWRKRERQSTPDDPRGHEWYVEEGPMLMTIDRIPMVPIIFGPRHGNSWLVDPPLRDAAYLQIELYQQENGLKNARIYTAYPMLAANGIEPMRGEDGSPMVGQVGPSAILYSGDQSGSNGRWEFVEPAATSLNFLREDIKDTIRELRELGRQPLTATSGNLTVITTAVAAQKGNSAIQVWAGLLGNGLQLCFDLTGAWYGLDEQKVELIVDTDFDIGFGDDASFKDVLAMHQASLISREATISEAKRRGILASMYDPEADLEFIDAVVDEDPDDDIDNGRDDDFDDEDDEDDLDDE